MSSIIILRPALTSNVEKSKGKEQPISAPNQSPAPMVKSTVPKPRPRPIVKQKAGPVPKAAPVPVAKPKDKGKNQDAPTVGPAPQRIAPGPLSALRPNGEIKVDRTRKRKFVEVEEESSDSGSERDDEDEDAYMAGRLNGLNTFVTMFETAFGALKKEVAEIDGYLGRKRRRHNH
jgi:outer membrane biosynthesis protein TonB